MTANSNMTSDEATLEFLSAMSGNSAQQALGLMLYRQRLEHNGYMRGLRDGGAAATDAAVLAMHLAIPTLRAAT
jgi:hypothetical protein